MMMHLGFCVIIRLVEDVVAMPSDTYPQFYTSETTYLDHKICLGISRIAELATQVSGDG
jgi:hypothetical protein